MNKSLQEKLAQIHLKLYHLSLDIDTTYDEAAMIGKILDSFDDAWEFYKVLEKMDSVVNMSEEKSIEISERGREAIMEKAIKVLQDREIQAAEDSGEEFFLGLPDAWYDPTPTYGCNNGHVSHRYLKSEDRGCLCLECHEGVAMLPHKYNTDEELKKALDEILKQRRMG